VRPGRSLWKRYLKLLLVAFLLTSAGRWSNLYLADRFPSHSDFIEKGVGAVLVLLLGFLVILPVLRMLGAWNDAEGFRRRKTNESD